MIQGDTVVWATSRAFLRDFQMDTYKDRNLILSFKKEVYCKK